MKQALNQKAFALSAGIMWGVGCFFMAIIAMYANGWAQGWMDLISSVYIGYDATWGGAITGALWGFVDFFIGGWLFAWLYNYFNR